MVCTSFQGSDVCYNSVIYIDFVKGKAGSVRSCSDDGASLAVLMGVEQDAILLDEPFVI